MSGYEFTDATVIPPDDPDDDVVLDVSSGQLQLADPRHVYYVVSQNRARKELICRRLWKFPDPTDQKVFTFKCSPELWLIIGGREDLLGSCFLFTGVM